MNEKKYIQMKHINTFLIIILLITGCVDKNKSTDSFIKIDIMDTPSAKKKLILQDFMDVEYIALETKEDFLNQGFVQAIGEEIILVRNRNSDGDIFVYDRKGKALRKINRKGQGGEEYTYITNITLDEDKNEMFVNDHFLSKIIVYDLFGNFKRRFNHKEGTSYRDIFNFDKDNLICCDEYGRDGSFVLVSKKDGRIIKDIKMPFKEKKLLMQQTKTLTVLPDYYRTIIPYNGNLILLELSSDTVYSLSPDCSLHPFFVRTPPVESMKPEVFLILRLLSDRYCFMESIKNVWDFDKHEGFPKTFIMYDSQEKSFFEYNVYNGDYLVEKELYMNALRPANREIESWQPLEANQLIDSYTNGELKGKLKEIAATLNEDSNPVIMLIKHKKYI